MALIGLLLDLDWVRLFRDRHSNDPMWAGLVSNFGVLLMTIAALRCLGTAVSMEGDRLPMIASASFAMVFAADDFFMLHESNFELLFFAGYAVLGLVVYHVSSRSTGLRLVWPLLVTGIAFSISVTVDLVWDELEAIGLPTLPRGHWKVGILLEDAFKLAGIVTFYLAVTAEARVQRVSTKTERAS